MSHIQMCVCMINTRIYQKYMCTHSSIFAFFFWARVTAYRSFQ